jgi:hypothetical protein
MASPKMIDVIERGGSSSSHSHRDAPIRDDDPAASDSPNGLIADSTANSTAETDSMAISDSNFDV